MEMGNRQDPNIEKNMEKNDGRFDTMTGENEYTYESNQRNQLSEKTLAAQLEKKRKKKRKKIFKNIAKIISFIFFPLLIPVYGTFMLFSMKLFSYYPTQYVNSAKSTIFIFGIILPCVTFGLLKLFKTISDVRVPRKEDRLIPFLIIGCLYLVCAYMLYNLAMPLWVINMILSVSFVIFLESIISQFWRISGHATSMGMLIGAIMVSGYSTYTNVCLLLCGFFLITGVVGSARLYLNRHTHAQLLCGFFLGLVSVILVSFLNPGQIFRLF